MPGRRIEDELQDAVSRGGGKVGFSGVVRVTLAGRPVFENAFGVTDRKTRAPNTPETRFGIASGTKLLTALAAGTLIDEGKVSFETPLTEAVRVPLPGISPAVTVRHLLTHTSGVYDYYDEEKIQDFDSFELGAPPSTLLGPRDYLPLITGYPMKFHPGERFSYSNSGYVLLGLLIEELSGSGYHEAVAERVLRPAGMDRSGFFRFDRLPENTARGYLETKAGWKTNESLLPMIGGPDGGAFSTAGDIEKLWNALLEGRLLSEKLTGTFLTAAVECKPGRWYGCGVWIGREEGTLPGLRIVGHDAGVSFRSTCAGSGTVATVVSNTSDGAWAMAREIEACLLRRGMEG